MLTKAITYENFNGEKKTKNFYFHFSRTELTKMQFNQEGGIQNKIKKMVESNDNQEIYTFFEEFVLAAYGEKSADGEEFLKSDAIRERFKCHPAYDVLMCEFIDGGDKAMSDFINAVIPKEFADEVAKADTKGKLNELVGFEVVPTDKPVEKSAG